MPFAVKDFRLAVDDAVCRGGIEPAVNSGTGIIGVFFALGNLEADAIGAQGKNGVTNAVF